MLLALTACVHAPQSPEVVHQPPPSLDEPAWYAQLEQARPELMTQHTGGTGDPAWRALVLRPKYRDELLHSPGATYRTIVDREYRPEDRTSDEAWAESLRAAQREYPSRTEVHPANYPLAIYTGYQVGNTRPLDAQGYTYKAFFELDDFQRSLSPAAYLAFVNDLAAVGFEGDSKIDLRPGFVRFQYNNIIVHAPSVPMALCAEQVGIASFGPAILHIARGIDAMNERPPLDWHHFLLTGRFDDLPNAIRDFVEYRTAVPTDACSNVPTAKTPG